MGRVKENLDIPSHIRNELNHHLSPNPARAEYLRQQFKIGSVGFAKRIWRDLRLGAYTCTGTFSHYAKILDATYMKGVPCGTFGLLASEGNVGSVPDVDKPKQYRLTVADIFFEFIKESDLHDAEPMTYFANQVSLTYIATIM